MNDELEAALEDYVELFNQEPPFPFGVTDEQMADVLREAVRKREPISDDYDWWGDLPDDADA